MQAGNDACPPHCCCCGVGEPCCDCGKVQGMGLDVAGNLIGRNGGITTAGFGFVTFDVAERAADYGWRRGSALADGRVLIGRAG